MVVVAESFGTWSASGMRSVSMSCRKIEARELIVEGGVLDSCLMRY
jgi:hypothetical protein